ncbi:N-acetyltransferase [Microbulbifer flavimaris]|uniref:N-acetyltransferase n=1 Tax=Microbulbifer flavimaris TaxID=1781068 RepID=A0ABX4HZ70_9GAMM|nr:MULTISPECIES: GNAT family N-acetyltransferase [Microbulbifer]KUJ82651.1 hypothetical protein AVO43_12755 [Microbulbifer sp. ZGT114]PCO04863.1 N-acetyltransferase [Microbulbifer flavimaris]
MEIFEYSASLRKAVVELMELLQDFESVLHPSRPPGKEVADKHFDYLLAMCNEYQGKVFVARHENEIVGFIVVLISGEDDGARHIYERYKRYGEITDLAVAEGFRRRGIAKLLIEKVEEYVSSLGVFTLQVSALAKNFAALSLYEETGFGAYEVTLIKYD